MSALQKKVLQSGLTPRPPIAGGKSGLGIVRKKRDYSALHWSKYFTGKRFVTLDNGDNFCVYEGGASRISEDSQDKSSHLPVLVFLHGGGYSALSWAQLSLCISCSVECRILALDLRGHGETEVNSIEEEYDLSAERLASDVIQVVKKILGDTDPPLVLVGHSMGGALAVHTALRNDALNNNDTLSGDDTDQESSDYNGIHNLVGICVIDVVEGTAMDALSSMQSFLRSRPKSFPSLDYAIEWAVRSDQVKNLDSARVSMPGQLKCIETGHCSAQAVQLDMNSRQLIEEQPSRGSSFSNCIGDTISEEPENERTSISKEDGQAPIQDEPSDVKDFKKPQLETAKLVQTPTYTRRVDLCRSEPHWTSCFEGLSSKFLSVSTSKLLVLAGVDRLDKDLTIGQMQGKFQMQILPQAGHAIHEDVPDKVSNILSTFLVRNKFAKALGGFSQSFPAC